MKKMLLIAAVFAFAVPFAGISTAQDDSLADHARQARKDKPGRPAAKKVYTDDDVPHVDRLSTVPAEGAATAQETTTSGAATPASEGVAEAKTPSAGEGDKTAPKKKEEDPQAKQKDWEGWKAKLQKQKETIALAERELSVLQREFKLRQAVYYGDVAQRMQNTAAWDREDSSYRDQIDKKQKDVDSAKAKLEQMQEDARRAGVPASFRE